MKTFKIILFYFAFCIQSIYSQSPVLFEVESSDKGILIPSVEEGAIANPIEGLTIYNSTNQLITWWDAQGFWVSLPSYKPFSSGIYTLDQRFFNNKGNMLFTHVGAQNIDTTGGWGYGNTIMGVYAAQSMTTSSANSFFGESTGINQKRGYGNTYLGFQAGYTADSSSINTFIGREAGRSLKRGNGSVVIGNRAMFMADSSSNNVVIGNEALRDGQGQTNNNVVIGNGALREFDKGWDNVVIGGEAGEKSDTLHGAILIGHRAGHMSRTPNIFIGNTAGEFATTGGGNTFIGGASGQYTTTGWGNTFVGNATGSYIGIGGENTFIGEGAGLAAVDAFSNTYIGQLAGRHNLGNGNVYIGRQVGVSDDGVSTYTEHNSLRVHNSNDSNPLIKGDFGTRELQVNGMLHITQTLKLEPKYSAPSCGAGNNGLLYVDGTSSPSVLKFCNGTEWVDLTGTP